MRTISIQCHNIWTKNKSRNGFHLKIYIYDSVLINSEIYLANSVIVGFKEEKIIYFFIYLLKCMSAKYFSLEGSMKILI